MMRLSTKAILLFLVPSSSGQVEEATLKDSVDFGIFDWVHNSPGGYYNQKQEFRAWDPNDPTSPLGVFAKERIYEGELLCLVPWDVIISNPTEEDDAQLTCGTAWQVALEMQLGNESKHAPYIHYLNAQREGQIPSAWSDAGKELLLDVLGPLSSTNISMTIPPEDPLSWVEEWKVKCKGSLDDEIGLKAALLVVQRADDDIMIPGYDMYNHRNGRYQNAKQIAHYGSNHETRASRNIEAGEQIYISYNHCPTCGGRSIGYGTAEIFRDYGFVELFPQHWHYYKNNELEFELEEAGDNSGKVRVVWKTKPTNKVDVAPIKAWLAQQLQRLIRQGRVQWNMGGNHQPPAHLRPDAVSEYEWDTVWRFHRANIVAMSAALEALESDLEETESPWLSTPDHHHYDSLEETVDDLDDEVPPCNWHEVIGNYDIVEQVGTFVHVIDFYQHTHEYDTCIGLEESIVTCSSSRPAHYEYLVHPAASYLKSPRRVVIVAEAASMILHEVIKYKDLESVVLLESDQEVTRSSFKHFDALPYFEDDRVEWWFGKPDESLGMLPGDYWGSFDLVLVDIDRGLLSPSLYDTATRLVSREGVFAMADYSMDQISRSFQYATRLFYDTPPGCGTVTLLGSHQVDFLRGETSDHSVQALLYSPVLVNEHKSMIMHDFRRRLVTSSEDTSVSAVELDRRAGVLTIVEAENVPVAVNELNSTMRRIVRQEGLTLLSNQSLDKDTYVFVFTNGYLVARHFSEESYIGFDVSLRGNPDEAKRLQAALTKDLNLKLPTTYNLVLRGGPPAESLGTTGNIASDDAKPRPEDSVKLQLDDPWDRVVKVALNEVLSSLGKSNPTTMAVCSYETEGSQQGCLAADLLSQHTNSEPVVLSTCPSLAALDTLDEEERDRTMIECEWKTMLRLKEIMELDSNIDAVAIDHSVPLAMLQILNSIWNTEEHRGKWLNLQEAVVAWSLTKEDSESYPVHHGLLELFRQGRRHVETVRGEIVIRDGKHKLDLGIVVMNMRRLVKRVMSLETTLGEHLGGISEALTVELVNVHGGSYKSSEHLHPKAFAQSDYASVAAAQQRVGQRHLGYQVVGQYSALDLEVSVEQIEEYLHDAIAATGLQVTSRHTVTEGFEGALMAIDCTEGNMVFEWNGEGEMSMNVFLFEEDESAINNLIDEFKEASGYMVIFRDDMPRGAGTIVEYYPYVEDDE